MYVCLSRTVVAVARLFVVLLACNCTANPVAASHTQLTSVPYNEIVTTVCVYVWESLALLPRPRFVSACHNFTLGRVCVCVGV